jgi:PKD repeat protein
MKNTPQRIRIVSLTFFVWFFSFGQVFADCSLSSTGNMPIPDLAAEKYLGFQGGLYPGGKNQPPNQHVAAAVDIATNQIKPLNAAGAVDLQNGKIVMVSVGMSNTSYEFDVFKSYGDNELSKNPQVIIVNGAQPGQAAPEWVNPAAPTWTNLNTRLVNAGVTSNQVQVAWLKLARKYPQNQGLFPLHAQSLQRDIEIIARDLKIHFPNIKIAFYSSRTRAYTMGLGNESPLNPEPYAYEGGFAVKWMIEDQINSVGNLNYDPARGPVVAPLIMWGPYLWADGLNSRSDGFIWECTDTVADFTHPSSTTGSPKVAKELLAFFKTHPASTPWFLKKSVVGQAPTIVSAIASPSAGTAPLGVGFQAVASDSDGTISEYVWTFDDGCFAYGPNPMKAFHGVGIHQVQLTVKDDKGNTAQRTITVDVGGSGGPQNQAPILDGAASCTPNPLQVSASGSFSVNAHDPDGDTLTYSWNFGDGDTAIGKSVTHAFASAGPYTATVNISDGRGAVAVSSTSVTVSPTTTLPVVTAVATDATASEVGGDIGRITFGRTGSTANALTLYLKKSGTAAMGTDYQSFSPTLVIPAGVSSVTIPITPIDDSTIEPTETAIIGLKASASYTLGTNNTVTVSIISNE